MSKKNERMETMKRSGIEVGKYFSLNLPDGLKPGSSVTLIVNEHGLPEFVDEFKKHELEIFANGYVKNTKLHRRWVMAQMFRMLNYKGKYYENGFDACLRNNYPYKYQFKMMLEEIRVLSILEKTDREAFEERVGFFNKDVVLATCHDYVDKLDNYINTIQVKKCKGVPYKRIAGKDVFCEDIYRKVISPRSRMIWRIKNSKDYSELHRNLRHFVSNMINLPEKTEKCKEWKDAFKGAGSYYTLKNMILFHNCYVVDPWTGQFMNRNNSLLWIDSKREEYQGEYWRLFALLKKVISDNNFDFDKRMREIYKK